MEDGVPADDKPESALQENIRKKGQYSYYYAHAKREDDEEQKEGEKLEGPGIVTGGTP